MKFIKNESGWGCRQNPFSFDIFEENGLFEVICHYGNATSNAENLSSLEIAKLWCSEFALKQTLKQLQAIAPEGGTTQYIDYEWIFTCDGAIPDIGYRCSLPIGHKGKCWSIVKKVDFVPEVK